MKYQNLISPLFLIITICIALSACSEKSSSKVKEVPAKELKKGKYIHSTFSSTKRGGVDFNVYLPPSWSKESTTEYPLIILLHGQGEDEHKFLGAFPLDSLNSWMNQKLIPEIVLIALRGGDNTNKMQWYTDPNEEMITSNEEGELRAYCHKMYKTSMKPSRISVIGHSRGATGALNFALYFPTKFASVVSSAFVSDYAIERLKQAANKNHSKIIESGIQIKLLIGTKDQFVLENDRKGSPIISDFLNKKGIQNTLENIDGKTHRLSELWTYPTNLKYLQFCAQSWK